MTKNMMSGLAALFSRKAELLREDDAALVSIEVSRLVDLVGVLDRVTIPPETEPALRSEPPGRKR
jgi:hypothetical protein